MAKKITPFLMFDGVAETAMNYYTSVFKNSKIVKIEFYGAGEQGKEGTVKNAEFFIGDEHFLCFDSAVRHDFDFTPSLSIFVDCENDSEICETFKLLSYGGEVLMPLDNYGFSKKFGWVNDQFGVSWQLILD